MNPDLKAPHLKSYYRDVKRVYKVDDYTVRFEYTKKYFRGIVMCGGFPVVPKHIVSQYKDFDASPYSRHPIGTGPYKFHSWTTNSRLKLVRNEDYWGPKPEIRVIEFKVVADRAIALQILKKGELDVSGLSILQWARQTRTEKFRNKFQIRMYPSTGYSFIGWNNESPIFKDVRVRQAMTHLLDREKINEKLNFGISTIVTGPFFPKGKQYNSSIKPLNYDILKAKKLLKEAGWIDSDGDGHLDKDGKKFEFTYLFAAGSKPAERVGTIYKEQLKRAGISMKMIRMEWAAFLDKINKRAFDATTLAWSSPFESDPFQIWDKSQAKEKHSSNFIGFVDDEASRLMREAKVEFNEKKRNQLYWKFQDIVHEKQPYTFLFNSPNLVAVSKRFGNVKTHTAGLELKEWTVKKSQKSKVEGQRSKVPPSPRLRRTGTGEKEMP